MKELILEELTARQKLGMCFPAYIYNWPEEDCEDNLAFTLSLIREHSLGAVWLSPNLFHRDEVMRMIKEAADYPIIVMCDAEDGFDRFKIGRHNSLACTGDPETAYTFGKCIAVEARRAGYNCLCNPVVDINVGNSVCGNVVRSLGDTKEKIAAYAGAMAQGMHDGGLLTVAKHYPSVAHGTIDTHMAEPIIEKDRQELVENNLYPYLELNKAGLLDGIMVGHSRIRNLDPDYPASLSKKIINIIREEGFDGFAITDALVMMGVVSRFGRERCRGMAIEAGNDLALCWGKDRPCFESLVKCYEDGIISDEALNRAARHVLEAQHKTLKEPRYTDLTPEDLESFDRINKECTYGYLEPGLSPALPRDGRHHFVVLIKSEAKLDADGKVSVDPLGKAWYEPSLIVEKLKADYPHSEVTCLREFPTAGENWDVLRTSIDYDDLVFVTFFESAAFIGLEKFTPRIISLIEALQMTGRISTLVHFGNPFLLEDLPHVPRVLVGCCSRQSVENTLDILAGRLALKGKAPYQVNIR